MAMNPRKSSPRTIDPAAIAKVCEHVEREVAYLDRLQERLKVHGRDAQARAAFDAAKGLRRLREAMKATEFVLPADFDEACEQVRGMLSTDPCPNDPPPARSARPA